MTDLTCATPVGSALSSTGSAEYIPGDVVRQLVAWSERDIDVLRAELEVALAEADAVERRLALLDPTASRADAVEGPLSSSATSPVAAPAEEAKWLPLNGWGHQDPTAAVPVVSDPTIMMPAVAAPTVSSPTIAMPAVPTPTVSDPTIAIPVVAAALPRSPFPQPIGSDPTAAIPAVSGSAVYEPIVAPTSEPVSPASSRPGGTGRPGRTTVVYRPPVSAPVEVDHSGAEGQADHDPAAWDSPESATRREIVGGRASLGDRLRTGWMMKAGMVIAVLGLVFLKFG